MEEKLPCHRKCQFSFPCLEKAVRIVLWCWLQQWELCASNIGPQFADRLHVEDLGKEFEYYHRSHIHSIIVAMYSQPAADDYQQ